MKKYLILLTLFIFSCDTNVIDTSKDIKPTQTLPPTIYYNDIGKNVISLPTISPNTKLEEKAPIYSGIDKEQRSDFRVSSSIEKQHYPNISINDKGDFVVSWVRVSKNNDFISIYARKFFADGTKTEEFKVNDNVIKVSDEDRIYAYSIGQKSAPKVSIDDKGNFSIVWQANKKLYIKSFDVSGKPYFNDMFLDDLEFENSKFNFIFDKELNYIVYDYQSVNFRGYTLKKIDLTGKLINTIYISEFLSSKNDIRINNQNEVILFNNNKTVKIDPRGYEIPLNELKDKDNYVNISINSNSNFLIVEDSNYDFFVTNKNNSKVKANNEKIPKEFNSLTSFDLNNNDDYVLVWGSQDSSYRSDYSINARVYNNKIKDSINIKVNSDNVLGFKSTPNVSLSNNGNFVTAWENWNDNKGEYQIFIRKLDINNSKTSNEVTKEVETSLCNEPVGYKDNMLKLPDDLSSFQTEEGQKRLDLLKETIEKIKSKPAYTGQIEIKVNEVANNKTNTELDKYASYVKINDTNPSGFQNATLIIQFSKSICKDKLFEKYKSVKIDKLNGYELITFDLSSIKISDFEPLIREFNKYNPEDIKKIESSSEEGLKTLLLMFDLKLNYGYMFKYVTLNSIMTSY